MISPGELTVPLLLDLMVEGQRLIDAATRARSLDREGCNQVCAAGARIAQLLGITAGIAGTDPPTAVLGDIDSDLENTFDMDPDPEEA